MVITPKDAHRFITIYTGVLLRLAGDKSRDLVGDRRLKALISARKKLLAKFKSRKNSEIFLPEDAADVRAAIQGIVFARWFYLRDTTKYSILVDAERQESYAVLGLNQPLAEIFNGPSVSFEAGVCPLSGQYICDGLFADPLYIGPNLRSDFRALQAKLARTGRFHKRP